MFRFISRSLLRDCGIPRHRYASTGVIKSPLSYDKIYSSSNQDIHSIPRFDPAKYSTASDGSGQDPFTGFIPPDEVEFRYSRSGGAGGQHVNKVATKVEVRFHVASASWIPEWLKPTLLEQERNHVTKSGHYVVCSERTRKQLVNQADCLEKVRAAVRRAERAASPHQVSEEQRHLLNNREQKSKAATLKEKRFNSLKKKSRQAPSATDT